MSDKIRLITVNNAFDPSDRTVEDMEWVRGKPMSEYLPSDLSKWLVTTTMTSIENNDILKTVYPLPDETIVICPIPLGGGDSSKSILRIAAFVALSAATGGASAALSGNIYLQSAAQFGMMIAGSYIINSVLPVPQVDSASASEGSSYGIDGVKNTSREGLPVPMSYGKFRTAGNIVSLVVENETATNQVVHMLINAGEAPISAIGNININDQVIGNYADWAVASKVESAAIINPYDWSSIETSSDGNQFPVAGSDAAKELAPKNFGSFNSINKSITLSTIPAIHTTTKTVNAVRVDLVAPSGLFKTSGGKLTGNLVNVVIEVKSTSGSTWKKVGADVIAINDIPEVYIYDHGVIPYAPDFPAVSSQASLTKTYNRDAITWTDDYTGVIYRSLDAYDVGASHFPAETHVVGSAHRREYHTSNIILAGKSTNSLRFSLMSEALPEDFYHVRVSRSDEEALDTDTSQVDTIIWSDISEIESENIGFKGTAMLAVRVRLSDQITSLPTVTYINHGRLVDYWVGDVGTGSWTNGSSSNPAWIAYDILTSPDAANQDASRINLDAWRRWATYCDAEDLTFNGIFEASSNVWDALQVVCRAGRAQIIPTGTKYTVTIEKPEAYSMTFGNGNIIEGTLTRQWLPMEGRANEVEITYSDKDDEYRANTVKVATDSVVNGEKQRLSSINIKGITDSARAEREAWLHINMNRFMRQSATFETTLESVGVLPGDVIRIQNDHPQWGFSGRTKSGSTNAVINLDRDITLLPSKTYGILMHYDSSVIGVGNVSDKTLDDIKITGIASGIVFKTGMRMTVGGVEMPIHHLDDAGTHYWASTSSTASISNGSSVVIIGSDVFEERQIATGSGTHSTVSLTSPFTLQPRANVNWIIGEQTVEGKPYRVTSVEMGSNVYQRKINCIEYDENSYEDQPVAAAPKKYSHIPNYIENITAISAGDSYETNGAALQATALLSWQQPSVGLYDGANVFVSTNGSAFESAGAARGGATTFSHPAQVGDQLNFKVVAYDKSGRTAPASSAPIVPIYMDGIDTSTTSFTLTVTTPQTNAIYLVWGDLDTENYAEVYRGTTDVFGEAVRVDKGQGGGYIDYVEADILYYYWVVFGDVTGTTWGAEVGPVSATAYGYDGIDVDWDDVTGEGFDANQRMNDATIPSGIHVGGFGDLTFKKV